MKCKNTFLGLFILLLGALLPGLGEAKSSVTDTRTPEGNLTAFETIYVSPLNFPADMDDMTRLKIQMMIESGFAKSSLPIIWPDSHNQAEIPQNVDNIGIMDIRVRTYGWSNYWTEGYYEDYYDEEYYDTWVTEPMYKDGKYAGERRRTIRVSRPVLRTRYVEPKYIEQALAQITFNLRDGESNQGLWYYSQNRFDTVGAFGANPSPDKSIKTIVEEALSAMNKRVKEDQKKTKSGEI